MLPRAPGDLASDGAVVGGPAVGGLGRVGGGGEGLTLRRRGFGGVEVHGLGFGFRCGFGSLALILLPAEALVEAAEVEGAGHGEQAAAVRVRVLGGERARRVKDEGRKLRWGFIRDFGGTCGVESGPDGF